MSAQKRQTDESQVTDQTDSQLPSGDHGRQLTDPMDVLPEKLENPDVYRAIKSAPPFRLRIPKRPKSDSSS